MLKVHIGCGKVYLNDYVNIDIVDSNCFLTQDRPDLVEKYKTSENDYHKKHRDICKDQVMSIKGIEETVCDRYGTFQYIPIVTGQADEILARHVFEHFSYIEAKKALDEAWRVLKSCGILRIDIPDTDKSLEQGIATGDSFYVRHILGPREKGTWGYHVMSYTRDALIKLMESSGFKYLSEEENIHYYPAFCLRFQKVPRNLTNTIFNAIQQYEKDPQNGCWNWGGSRSNSGYGSISIQAHRLFYEIYKGVIPQGLQLDHLCRNRACVNPDHLEPVTIAVNVLRGECPAAKNARKTHCKNGHEFTQENTEYYIHNKYKRKYRRCKICNKKKKTRNYDPLKYKEQNKTCKNGHKYENHFAKDGRRLCLICKGNK